MRTKWAKKISDMIASGTLPEAHIRKMRTILARAKNKGLNSWMTGTPSCNPEDVDAIIQLIEMHTPRVTDEQAKKGAHWLTSHIYTKRGDVRNTEFARQFTAADRECITSCNGFSLVSLYDSTTHGDRYTTFSPIYRCHGDNGAFFDYVARAWQSGGNSFVIDRG